MHQCYRTHSGRKTWTLPPSLFLMVVVVKQPLLQSASLRVQCVNVHLSNRAAAAAGYQCGQHAEHAVLHLQRSSDINRERWGEICPYDGPSRTTSCRRSVGTELKVVFCARRIEKKGGGGREGELVKLWDSGDFVKHFNIVSQTGALIRYIHCV